MKIKHALGGTFVLGAVLFGGAEASAATMKPLQMIHDETLAKFTPIEQWEDDEPRNPSGDVPFTGDCDDYYAAAFNQMQAFAYKPFAMIVTTKGSGLGHIMACVKLDGLTRCLDNRNKKVLRPSMIRKYYLVDRKVYPKNYSGEK